MLTGSIQRFSCFCRHLLEGVCSSRQGDGCVFSIHRVNRESVGVMAPFNCSILFSYENVLYNTFAWEDKIYQLKDAMTAIDTRFRVVNMNA